MIALCDVLVKFGTCRSPHSGYEIPVPVKKAEKSVESSITQLLVVGTDQQKR